MSHDSLFCSRDLAARSIDESLGSEVARNGGKLFNDGVQNYPSVAGGQSFEQFKAEFRAVGGDGELLQVRQEQELERQS